MLIICLNFTVKKQEYPDFPSEGADLPKSQQKKQNFDALQLGDGEEECWKSAQGTRVLKRGIED